EITNPRNGGRLEKRQGKGGQGKGGQGGQGQGGQGGQGQGGQGGQGQGGQGGQGGQDQGGQGGQGQGGQGGQGQGGQGGQGRRNTGTSASTESKNTIYASYPYEGLPTCKSASDPECTPSNGQPIIKTITLADKIIPPPSGADPSNIKNTTYITTYTEYIASHSET
ncbi:24679_t:CDS:2, partial [Gigaspora rosea]